MVEIRLGTNFLTGPIPSELGLLFNLTTLELQFNAAMTGTIPPEVLLLEKLETLNVTGTGIVMDGEVGPPSTATPSAQSTGSPAVDPTPTTDTLAPTIAVSGP